MKNGIRSTLRLVGILSLAGTFLTAQMAVAQAAKAAPKINPAQQMRYPQADLELLRAKFLEVVDSVAEASILTNPGDTKSAASLENARKSIEQMPLDELSLLRGVMDPATMNSGLPQARATMERVWSDALRRQSAKTLESYTRSSAKTLGALTDRAASESITCSNLFTGRPSAVTEDAANVIWVAAAGLRAGFSRACNEVLVILGEGGNTSVACIPIDVVYFVATGLRQTLQACETGFTNRTVDANYDRLNDLNNNLGTVNDNVSSRASTTLVNTSTAGLTTLVTDKATALTTLINTSTADIESKIGQGTSTVVDNANANTLAITTLTDKDMNIVRDLMLRSWIELALAADGADVVAFQTTSGHGGYLELVRTITAQAMANVMATPGGKIGDAQKQLTQGDTALAAGQYKSAYGFYRQAYQSASKN